jgi:hypothetical protein
VATLRHARAVLEPLGTPSLLGEIDALLA